VVQIQDGSVVVLIKGSISLRDFGALTKMFGDETVLCLQTATLADANFALASKAAQDDGFLDNLKSQLQTDYRERWRAKHPELCPIELEWLATGERGASSEAMFEYFTGVNPSSKPRSYERFDMPYPHDAADFRRCIGLLNAVPSFRDRLSEMVDVSWKWERLVENWNSLESMVDQDQFQKRLDAIYQSPSQAPATNHRG
jgi:hypothetical protein